MATTYTDHLGLDKPDRYADEKETLYARAHDKIASAIAGFAQITSGDATYTLDEGDASLPGESRTFALKLTSTLTAARTIKIPIDSGTYRNRMFLIWNATAGGFKVTIKTTAGGSPTGVDISNGAARLVWHDGTNVYAAGPEMTPTTGLVPAPTFIAPSLLNSWVNFGSGAVDAGYAKTAEGMILIRGLVKTGTTTAGTVIFNLPVGYRPSGIYHFATASNGAYGQLSVLANGDVRIEVGSATYLSLNLSFVP